MLETIQRKLFDILEVDSRLLASGAAMDPLDGIPGHPAFPGIRRPERGTPAEPGYVNLFEFPWERSSSMDRPAIYCGMYKNEPTERNDPAAVCVNADGIVYKVARMPMVVITHGDTESAARRIRNQLYYNMLRVIADKQYRLQVGHWYNMVINDGETITWTTASGGQDSGIVMAAAIVPVHAQFSFRSGA